LTKKLLETSDAFEIVSFAKERDSLELVKVFA
jgi:hypothetical protein